MFIQFDGQGLAVECIGQEDSIFIVVVAEAEDIGTLDCLVEETLSMLSWLATCAYVATKNETAYKNVHDQEDALLRFLGRASHVGLLSINLLVRSLGLVATGHHRRDVAARLVVAVASLHARHFDGLGRERFAESLCRVWSRR